MTNPKVVNVRLIDNRYYVIYSDGSKLDWAVYIKSKD